MFGLIRRWRRRRLLRESIDPGWVKIIEDRVPFFARLDGAVRQRFLDDRELL